MPKFGTDGMVPTSRRKRYNYKRQCKNCKLYVQERHRAQHTSECVGSGAWVEGFGGALKVHTKKIRRVAAQPRVPTHARNGKRACRFRKHVSRRQPKTAPKDTSGQRLLYTGHVAGSSSTNGVAQYLCLTHSMALDEFMLAGGPTAAKQHRVEYGVLSLRNSLNMPYLVGTAHLDAECSVCHAPERSWSMTLAGRQDCNASTFELDYAGYLMADSGHRSAHIQLAWDEIRHRGALSFRPFELSFVCAWISRLPVFGYRIPQKSTRSHMPCLVTPSLLR